MTREALAAIDHKIALYGGSRPAGRHGQHGAAPAVALVTPINDTKETA